jgi:hypothetical protein
MSHDPAFPDRPWPALQRAEADRVLRRAIEIETKGGEWLDGEQPREVADAVELDPRPVERALAEEPTRNSRQGDWRPHRVLVHGTYVSILGALGGLVVLLLGVVFSALGMPSVAAGVEWVGNWLVALGTLGTLLGMLCVFAGAVIDHVRHGG